MRYKTLIILVLLFFCFVTPTYVMRVGDYKDLKKNLKEADFFIIGIANGILITKYILQEMGREPFLCKPVNLRLSGENYRDIIEDEILKGKYNTDNDLSEVLHSFIRFSTVNRAG